MSSESDQIKNVESFEALTKTIFFGKNNAICWKRDLDIDFSEIVTKLILNENITTIEISDLLKLNLSFEGNQARKIIINDLKLLTDFGAQPTLNLIKYYDRDDTFEFISTDVYSFHVDKSPVLIDTYLCTYFGASSDIIKNEEVDQKILIPEVRNKLKNLYDGPDENFELFLEEHFFDLHYEMKKNAKPINLGNGNIWRLAVKHPDQRVLPCVHRAPIENTNEFRLMLIC